jgi:hypothetical protein
VAVDFSLITVIGMAVALVVGKVLKENPAVKNRLIPWATLLISLLTQIFEATPVAAGISLGGFLGSNFGQMLFQTLIQWLATTGTHSVAKNVTQP